MVRGSNSRQEMNLQVNGVPDAGQTLGQAQRQGAENAEDAVKRVIKKLVERYPQGLRVSHLLVEFKEITGRELPLALFNCTQPEDLLREIPEAVDCGYNEEGNFVVIPVSRGFKGKNAPRPVISSKKDDTGHKSKQEASTCLMDMICDSRARLTPRQSRSCLVSVVGVNEKRPLVGPTVIYPLDEDSHEETKSGLFFKHRMVPTSVLRFQVKKEVKPLSVNATASGQLVSEKFKLLLRRKRGVPREVQQSPKPKESMSPPPPPPDSPQVNDRKLESSNEENEDIYFSDPSSASEDSLDSRVDSNEDLRVPHQVAVIFRRIIKRFKKGITASAFSSMYKRETGYVMNCLRWGFASPIEVIFAVPTILRLEPPNDWFAYALGSEYEIEGDPVGEYILYDARRPLRPVLPQLLRNNLSAGIKT